MSQLKDESNNEIRHALKGGGGSRKSEPEIRSPVVEANTLFSQTYVSGVAVISHGPISGFVTDAFRDTYLDNTPIMAASGNLNLPDVAVENRNGFDPQPALGIERNGQTFAVDTEILFGNSVTRTYVSQGYNPVIYIRYRIAQLVNVDSTTGDQSRARLILDVHVSKNSGSWAHWTRLDFFDKTSTPFEDTLTYLLSGSVPGDEWTFRLTKVTQDSTSSYFGNVAWIDTVLLGDGGRTYPGTAVVSISTSSDAFSGYPAVELNAKGMLVSTPHTQNGFYPNFSYSGSFNGTLLPLRYTNDPVWILYWLLTQPRTGEGYGISPGDIDVFSFYAAALRNSERLPNDPNTRYTFNRYLISKVDRDELKDEILASMHANLVDIGGKMTVVQDRPAPVTRTFNSSQVVVTIDQRGGESDPFTYSVPELGSLFTSIEVEFLDIYPQLYRTHTESYDAGLLRLPKRRQKVSINRVCNAMEASREARWRLYTNLKAKIVEFTVTVAEMSADSPLALGSLFDVQDDSIIGYEPIHGGGALTYTGRCEIISTSAIEASPKVDLTHFEVAIGLGVPYELDVTEPSGIMSRYSVTAINNTTKQVTVSGDLTVNGLSVGDRVVPWSLARADGLDRRETYRCIGLKPDLAKATILVTAVEYDPVAKWNYVDAAIIPPWDTLTRLLNTYVDPGTIQDVDISVSSVSQGDSFYSKVEIEWSRSSTSATPVFIDYWEASIREQGSHSWTSLGRLNEPRIEVFDVPDGTLFFRVRVRTVLGRYGRFYEDSVVILQKGAAVPNVVIAGTTTLSDSIKVLFAPTIDARRETILKLQVAHHPRSLRVNWEGSKFTGIYPADEDQIMLQARDGFYLFKYVIPSVTPPIESVNYAQIEVNASQLNHPKYNYAYREGLASSHEGAYTQIKDESNNEFYQGTYYHQQFIYPTFTLFNFTEVANWEEANDGPVSPTVRLTNPSNRGVLCDYLYLRFYPGYVPDESEREKFKFTFTISTALEWASEVSFLAGTPEQPEGYSVKRYAILNEPEEGYPLDGDTEIIEIESSTVSEFSINAYSVRFCLVIETPPGENIRLINDAVSIQMDTDFMQGRVTTNSTTGSATVQLPNELRIPAPDERVNLRFYIVNPLQGDEIVRTNGSSVFTQFSFTTFNSVLAQSDPFYDRSREVAWSLYGPT